MRTVCSKTSNITTKTGSLCRCNPAATTLPLAWCPMCCQLEAVSRSQAMKACWANLASFPRKNMAMCWHLSKKEIKILSLSAPCWLPPRLCSGGFVCAIDHEAGRKAHDLLRRHKTGSSGEFLYRPCRPLNLFCRPVSKDVKLFSFDGGAVWDSISECNDCKSCERPYWVVGTAYNNSLDI